MNLVYKQGQEYEFPFQTSIQKSTSPPQKPIILYLTPHWYRPPQNCVKLPQPPAAVVQPFNWCKGKCPFEYNYCSKKKFRVFLSTTMQKKLNFQLYVQKIIRQGWGFFCIIFFFGRQKPRNMLKFWSYSGQNSIPSMPFYPPPPLKLGCFMNPKEMDYNLCCSLTNLV